MRPGGLLAVQVELSTVLLVGGMLMLVAAVIFTAWPERPSQKPDVLERREPIRRVTNQNVIHRHTTLQLGQGAIGDRQVVVAGETEPVGKETPETPASAPSPPAGPSAETLSPQQQALLADLRWLEQRYQDDPVAAESGVAEARKIVEQLADAEPARMVMLLRTWLRGEDDTRR